LKEKYIQKYGSQYEVISPNNQKLMKLFYEKCDAHGIMHGNDKIFKYLQTFEEKQMARQMSLWEM